MSTHHDRARMTIDMPFDEHKKLKAMAAIMGVSLRELVLSCLRDNLLSQNKPNKETLAAFRKTDKNEDLVECDNFEDFIDKLGY